MASSEEQTTESEFPYPGFPETRGGLGFLNGKRPAWAGPPPPRESLRHRASRWLAGLQKLIRRS
jgi:hypothetical protein